MANIFRTASIWLKIAIICCALGLVIFIIGFATTSWMTTKDHNRSFYNGLWQEKYCKRGGSCRTHSYTSLNDYHRAIQAMECLGLIGFTLSLATLLLYLCMDSFRRRDFLQAATAFTFAGIFFASVGFALFGSKDNEENHKALRDIGWSMGIAIAGTILYGIAGLCLILQLVR
ncbi:lens fiber membrane intrinsic protein-like [Plakobranchus ocellatus]|uniref:Lens fiber membrane intrinsic protein-like n=1 Tax=Plakobranchus ocellatus TaxID=259542 RepID=A0AAV4AAQ5_9GAST|nr:lens fiber membrane intrinsic protein-like [Plakobranchus ocellatus]